MNEFLLVMLGGAVGSGLRYGVGLLLPTTEGGFPWPTFIVNLVGSCVLGLLMGVSLTSSSLPRPIMLLLGTGLCGGFTTYSAFTIESALLAQDGQIMMAAVYVSATLVACGTAAIAGLFLPRLIAH